MTPSSASRSHSGRRSARDDLPSSGYRRRRQLRGRRRRARRRRHRRQQPISPPEPAWPGSGPLRRTRSTIRFKIPPARRRCAAAASSSTTKGAPGRMPSAVHGEVDRRPEPARRSGRVESDTDIALIKVHSVQEIRACRARRLGQSGRQIGAPSARKCTSIQAHGHGGRGQLHRAEAIFDMSLDNYIQTDAAIGSGNSGGPLINAHSESSASIPPSAGRRAASGFAVRSNNQAKAILPQLKAKGGRVARLVIGVALRDVDPGLAFRCSCRRAPRPRCGRHRRVARRACRAEAVRPK